MGRVKGKSVRPMEEVSCGGYARNSVACPILPRKVDLTLLNFLVDVPEAKDCSQSRLTVERVWIVALKHTKTPCRPYITFYRGGEMHVGRQTPRQTVMQAGGTSRARLLQTRDQVRKN